VFIPVAGNTAAEYPNEYTVYRVPSGADPGCLIQGDLQPYEAPDLGSATLVPYMLLIVLYN
jgi:hypothetical protein